MQSPQSDTNKTIAPIPPWSLQAINSRIRNPTRDLIEIYFMGETGDIYKSDSKLATIYVRQKFL
jgi:cytidine deaminase